MDSRLPKIMRDNPHLCSLIDRINHQGFTDLPNEEEKIKFTLIICLQHIRDLHLGAEIKSTAKAAEFRKLGNEQFISNMYSNLDNIIEIYTKSVAHAPSDTKELALAYANRSAALFKAKLFEDCLLDIERALEDELYPDNLRSKLLVRKIRCLKALKNDLELKKTVRDSYVWFEKNDSDKSNKKVVDEIVQNSGEKSETPFEKWTEDYCPELTNESSQVPGVSGGLELKFSPEFGRHYVAVKDINPGEILGVQVPYAKVIIPEMYYKLCWHCAKQVWSGIPCDECVYAVFCNEECKQNSYSQYHYTECMVLPYFQATELDHIALMAIRLTILAVKEHGGIEDVQRMIKRVDSCSDILTRGFSKGSLHPSKFSSISGLEKHSQNRSPGAQWCWSFMSILIAQHMASRTNILKETLLDDLAIMIQDDNFMFLAELMFRNMQTAAYNGYFITSERYGQTLKRYFAVAPGFSLFNHSCYKSAAIHDFKDNLAIYALTPIKCGEQVFINYGYDFQTNSRSERQEKLKIEYCFKCNCIACKNNWTANDCCSFRRQEEISMIGRVTINEVLDQKDRMIGLIFNRNYQDINFTLRILKLTESIARFSEHAQLPCKELLDLQKSLDSAFRFYGNRLQSVE